LYDLSYIVIVLALSYEVMIILTCKSYRKLIVRYFVNWTPDYRINT